MNWYAQEQPMANWIKKAVPAKNRGLFKRKAKAEGESTKEYASEVIDKSKESGEKGSKLLKEALFARTMARMKGK